MTDTTTVNTEYGPVTIPRKLLRLWDMYGWPTDEALKRMAEENHAALGQAGQP